MASGASLDVASLFHAVSHDLKMPKDAVAATVGRLNAPRNPVGAMLVGLKTLQIAAVAAAAAPKTPRNAVVTAVVCLLAACGQGRDAGEDGNDQAPVTGLADEVNAAAMPEQAEDRVILWGDTHLHTLNSTDAYESGVANADIDTAFRYAKGFPVVHPRTGLRIRIDEPLDFLVVADHAEMLGMFPRLRDRDPDVLATAGGQELLALFEEGADTAFGALVRLAVDPTDSAIADDLNAPSIRQTSWDAQVDAAERHNDPGTFTALNGWEWSSTPGGLNLHRVVFTPADADTARQFLPFSNFDSIDPKDLWAYLRDVRERTGADFVAIPHNSNLSNGLMFQTVREGGLPFDSDYARERMAWEPVVEITQYKGTSETHPALSPTDEFADFEIRNILLTGAPAMPDPGSYVRSALLQGLSQEADIGVNPFQFGLIGASDSHTGFASVTETDFLGKSGEDLLPEERAAGNLGDVFGGWQVSASGLAAVWADRNDRQAVFDAFKRREVYATTGPRIALRLFAGYDFAPGDEDARDLGMEGYLRGVPMGGVLLPAEDGAAPAFVIAAARDPASALLDRIQVVKGWRDAAGALHERIFDVAWSGQREVGADGNLEPVGDTVDPATSRYTNTIGAAELAAHWRDPEFDPAEAAFYYVRVLEIPTPRHHVSEALALGLDPAALDFATTIQERAFSSPVWYSP